MTINPRITVATKKVIVSVKKGGVLLRVAEAKIGNRAPKKIDQNVG